VDLPASRTPRPGGAEDGIAVEARDLRLELTSRRRSVPAPGISPTTRICPSLELEGIDVELEVEAREEIEGTGRRRDPDVRPQPAHRGEGPHPSARADDGRRRTDSTSASASDAPARSPSLFNERSTRWLARRPGARPALRVRSRERGLRRNRTNPPRARRRAEDSGADGVGEHGAEMLTRPPAHNGATFSAKSRIARVTRSWSRPPTWN
jgi:hypothetical protein